MRHAGSDFFSYQKKEDTTTRIWLAVQENMIGTLQDRYGI
jgi:hypothetical protein